MGSLVNKYEREKERSYIYKYAHSTYIIPEIYITFWSFADKFLENSLYNFSVNITQSLYEVKTHI